MIPETSSASCCIQQPVDMPIDLTNALAYVPSSPYTSTGGAVLCCEPEEEAGLLCSAKPLVAAMEKRGAATRAPRAATRAASIVSVDGEENWE